MNVMKDAITKGGGVLEVGRRSGALYIDLASSLLDVPGHVTAAPLGTLVKGSGLIST